jgi:large subunit ribosomal protein L29
MKADDFRNMTDAEVEEKLRGFQEELFNLRFRLATEQVENPLRIRKLRRDTARGLTILRERELRREEGSGD